MDVRILHKGGLTAKDDPEGCERKRSWPAYFKVQSLDIVQKKAGISQPKQLNFGLTVESGTFRLRRNSKTAKFGIFSIYGLNSNEQQSVMA
jgi:hypothetical protein